MKAIKVIAVILVILALLVAAGLFMVTRFVNQPEFRQQLVGLASKATGTAVQVTDMKVSIFSGIELRGVAIGNPGGFTGDLMTAKAFVLRYQLWPLLQKRVEVETLLLDSPVITLAKNAQGEWNYDKIGGKAEKVKSTGPTEAPSASAGGLDISLQKIEMKNAAVTMVKADGKELLRIQDASFASTISLAGGQMSGNGNARIELVNAANSLMIRNVATPVALTPAAVKLAPLTGKLAGGDVTGEAGLSLAGDSKYTVDLHVKDADIVTLLKEANTSPLFASGKLQLNSALTGTGGAETIVGGGKAEIVGGQLVNIPLLNDLATVLQVPALRDMKFDEFKMEYTISNNVVQTPVINIKSPLVQLAGKGQLTLADNKLDHAFTLTLAASVLDHAPKEVRQLFTKNADGSYAIDFKVWGPYDAPQNDLQKKVLQGVGEQLLDKGLKKLFKQMRIIAGIAKGMVLAVPRGSDTRPTSDRVREAIFSSLGASVVDADVLDLYAGTGALGLEAGDRGARSVLLVERARQALDCIAKNIAGFEKQRGEKPAIEVRRGEVLRELGKLARQFTLIFADPPYDVEPEPLLAAVVESGVLAADGLVVLETSRRTELRLTELWQSERDAIYGDTRVSRLGLLR